MKLSPLIMWPIIIIAIILLAFTSCTKETIEPTVCMECVHRITEKNIITNEYNYIKDDKYIECDYTDLQLREMSSKLSTNDTTGNIVTMTYFSCGYGENNYLLNN